MAHECYYYDLKDLDQIEQTQFGENGCRFVVTSRKRVSNVCYVVRPKRIDELMWENWRIPIRKLVEIISKFQVIINEKLPKTSLMNSKADIDLNFTETFSSS